MFDERDEQLKDFRRERYRLVVVQERTRREVYAIGIEFVVL